MSEAIDRIRAHFDAIAKRKIDVPEWGLEIHSTPLTIAERARIYRGLADDDSHTPLVRVLIVKSMDDQGNPVFSKADETHLLNHADPQIVVRVASEILSNEAPDARELGNS